MISRRQFLIGAAGAAAGLILPDWVVRAERFIETEDAPLLEPPTIARTRVNAVYLDGIDDIRLLVGDPYKEPPRLTWSQYFERYYGDEYGSFEEFALEWYGVRLNPMAEADDWVVMDTWLSRNEAPDTKGYAYLEQFNIGPELDVGDTVGRVDFVNGTCPGNGSRFVSVPDLLSLSLLQKRLNQIGTDTEISYLGAVEL